MSNRGAMSAVAAAVVAASVAMAVWAMHRPAGRIEPPGRHLSEAEAVHWADEFCKAIGVTLAQPPVAIYPAPNEYPDQQDVYWGKRWRLKYPDGTEIQVADGSGIVTRYINEAVAETMLQSDKGALPESKALAIAEKVRQASGQMTELGGPKARLLDLESLGTRWSVTWPRIAGGTEYSDQNAEVTMVGPSGAIIYYVVRFRSPAAPAEAPRITRAQAEETARKCLRDHGIQGAALRESSLKAVQPNRKWEVADPDASGSEEPTGGPARQAWVCSFGTDINRFYSVFIDAGTGRVIGGQMWAFR